MKKWKCKFVFIITLAFALIADDNVGLIFVGIDTLNSISWQGYFDFVLQRPCTSEVDYNSTEFQDHVRFAWDIPSKYAFGLTEINQPCLKEYGKINLDSIKVAPPDSQLVNDIGAGLYLVFYVIPDSLMSLKGNSYVIMTRRDPRPFWEGHFFAKLKILYFNIIDSTNHEVEMVFLWACQMNHSKQLDTMGIDTFDLTVPISSDFHKPQIHHNRIQTVFKVVGSRFTIPINLVGKVQYAEIYDLRGRLMGRINIGKKQKIVDINKINRGNKIYILKINKF